MKAKERRQLAEELWGKEVGCGAAICVFGRAPGLASNGPCSCKKESGTAGRLAHMVDAALERAAANAACRDAAEFETKQRVLAARPTTAYLKDLELDVLPLLPAGWTWDDDGTSVLKGDVRPGYISQDSNWMRGEICTWNSRETRREVCCNRYHARIWLALQAWNDGGGGGRS